jgi:hypothetical protein
VFVVTSFQKNHQRKRFNDNVRVCDFRHETFTRSAMMLTSVLLSVLVASPTVGVVLSKRGGVSLNDANARVLMVEKALGVPASVSGFDLSECGGKIGCLVKFGREKNFAVLVAVETASVLDEAIVSVRAISVEEDGKLLDTASVKAPGSALDAALKTALMPMGTKLKERLAPQVVVAPPAPVAPPMPPTERGEDVKPVPRVAGADTAGLPTTRVDDGVRTATRTGLSPIARWGPLGISLALVAAGGVSFGLSKGPATRLKNDTLNDAQIDELASRGQTLQTLGLIGLIGGGVSAAGSLIFALIYPYEEQSVAVSGYAFGGNVGLTLSGRWP